jgi:hypothetical protein
MTDGKKGYFLTTVLPSLGIPEKGTYNMDEVKTILAVSIRTVERMIADGRLVASHVRPGKKGSKGRVVYKQTLIEFFSQWDE